MKYQIFTKYCPTPSLDEPPIQSETQGIWYAKVRVVKIVSRGRIHDHSIL